MPSHLIGDPGRLRQVLLNLAGNAIKFTEKGEVLIEIAMQSQHDGLVELHFKVTDTGIGIPSEKHQTPLPRFHPGGHQHDSKIWRDRTGFGNFRTPG